MTSISVRRTCNALEHAYGSPRHNNKRNPLNELVFILLSQKTGRWAYEVAHRDLRRLYPSWGLVRDAPVADLAAVLRPAGLSNHRAARIRLILERLCADFGRPTLAPLRRMSDQEAEAYLTSLPGVGEKTAKCVLMYALDRNVLPVDTHVRRVATRLGLLPVRTSDRRAHEILASRIPPGARYGFHVNAVAHGRLVCTKRRPACDRCPLRGWCPYPGQTRARDGGSLGG